MNPKKWQVRHEYDMIGSIRGKFPVPAIGDPALSERKPAFLALDQPAQERNPYPPPYDHATDGRFRRVLGEPFGLTKFGVNLTELKPGSASSLRHWHTAEDEFVYVLEGAPTLVTEAGEFELSPGMCAGFPADSGDGHRMENRSGETVRYLEVGNRSPAEKVHYSDADLRLEKSEDGSRRFVHRDGTPY